MKTVINNYEACNAEAAAQIRRILRGKPDAVLALSAGRTPRGLYEELSRLCRAGELSFRDAKLFAVTEFEGVDEERSCRRMLETCFVEKTDIRPENCRYLSPENLGDYDAQIKAAGGLDVAVLGLGANAHIGYNEPAVPYDSLSHRQKLTDATKRQNAAVFGSEEEVPEYGYTMGIYTLVWASEIIVLAFGEEKAEAVHKMLYARSDSSVPAAFLQIPRDVTVYLDQAAAGMV
ncbi:MAG: glucosamine-6-phosphate deaminase [Oscillospiraceae bacterium]|nr:glucosamine-6-phosphate deaminase [Oscillospiraceae bacterium]